MAIEIPPLAVASSSKLAVDTPSLYSISSLNQPSYASGSTARHLSGQLGHAAGYEEVALVGRREADRSKRRRAAKKAADALNPTKTTTDKGKGRQTTDSDSDDDSDEDDEDEHELYSANEKTDGMTDKENWQTELDDTDDQSSRAGGSTTSARPSAVKRTRAKGKEREDGASRTGKRLRSIFVGDMDYLAIPHPAASKLPPSTLLRGIARYADHFFRHPPTYPIFHRPRPRTPHDPATARQGSVLGGSPSADDPLSDEDGDDEPRELDGDHLISLGIFVEEIIKDIIENSACLAPSRPRSPSLPPTLPPSSPPSRRNSDPSSSSSSSSSSTSPPAPPSTQRTVTFDLSSQPGPLHRARTFSESSESDGGPNTSILPTRIERPQSGAESRAARKEEIRKDRMKKKRGRAQQGQGRAGGGSGAEEGDGKRRKGARKVQGKKRLVTDSP